MTRDKAAVLSSILCHVPRNILLTCKLHTNTISHVPCSVLYKDLSTLMSAFTACCTDINDIMGNLEKVYTEMYMLYIKLLFVETSCKVYVRVGML